MPPVRVLFVTLPERGHLNPMLGLAQAFAHAGHRIGVFCHDDISDALRRAGISCDLATEDKRGRKPTASAASLERLNDIRWLTYWCDFGMRSVMEPSILDPLRAFVSSFRPDVICLDPLAYHGVVVAETERIPWVGISTNLLPLAPSSWRSPMVDVYRKLAPARDRLFAKQGTSARFKVNEAISPWLNTVFTTETFVPRAGSDNDHSFYVGPVLPRQDRGDEQPFPWDDLPTDGPIVYLSFGSQISYGKQLTLDLVRALAQDAHIVVSLKGLLPELVPQLPGNVTAVSYAPQLALLERVDAMVTHGGANSVMECLSRGRPMLVVPTVNDGPLTAYFVEQAGAGKSVPLADLDVTRCRGAVAAMLPADAAARRKAAEIARSYAAHDGATRTHELVLELARTGAPLRPELNRS